MSFIRTLTLCGLALSLAATVFACDDGTTPVDSGPDGLVDAGPDAGEADVAVADAGTSDASLDGSPDAGPDSSPDGTILPIDELTVGEGAANLSFTDQVAVWAELSYVEDPTCDMGGECFGDGCKAIRTGPDTYVCQRLTAGQIWIYDRATGEKRELDAGSSAVKKDPVVSGSTIVWADKRNGTDFDLWRHDLGTGTSSSLVMALGDQDEPTLSGSRLAWVGRNAPPHGAAEREIWTMDITDAGSQKRLTNDTMEQTQPHCSHTRCVWADYGADPDGVYQPIADPSANNGDILGYDVTTDTTFTVTSDPSKQLRPAIDGEFIVWLDWRGINPEPKYSAFKVYGGRLDDQLVVMAEHEIAVSSWQRPSLWQRPTVKTNGLAGWIQEGGAGALSAVFVSPIGPQAQPLELISAQDGFFEGVQFLEDQIGYVGAGSIGWLPLSDLPGPGGPAIP